MKNLMLLVVCTSLSCSEKELDVLSERPPFDEFWFSTRFDYSVGSATYSGLRYYNVWGKMRNESVTGGTYWYYLSNTSVENPGGNGQLPAGGKLTITNKGGGVIQIEGSGVLPREGNRIPNAYVGDPELWNSTQCGYTIIIHANTTTKQIIKASYELGNGKFNTKQDITSAMGFYEGTDFWSISSTPAMVIANGNITFLMDLK
jgi:hypothetical protein